MADYSFSNFDSEESSAPTKPTTKSGQPSVYDKMRAELAKPAVVEQFKIMKVGPTRPGFALKVSTDLPIEKLDRWRVAARKVRGKEAIDVRVYNCFVLRSQVVGLLFEGEEVFGESGEPLHFGSDEFREMVGGLDYQAAIQAFFERDADIIKFGTDILEACGYVDSDEDDEDPLDSENV